MGVNTTEVISRVIRVNSLQSEGPGGEPGGKTGEGPAQGWSQDGDESVLIRTGSSWGTEESYGLTGGVKKNTSQRFQG